MKDPTTKILKDIREKKSAYWEKVRERNALSLFHKAAERVPAYKDFLKKHGIAHRSIKTFNDFQSVPHTNKDNYLREYPLAALTWDNNIQRSLVFTSTSGSTGAPFYFSRTNKLDWQYSVAQELFFSNRPQKGPTLVIVCFGMGVWIGGLITYKAIELMSNRQKYPVSILTPGINKDEIFHALKSLAPHFRHTVLCGYPPFIKDLIDEAAERGVDLKALDVRYTFAAESFTEEFRDYIAEHSGIIDPSTGTMNVYGSADIGAMAFETPMSIGARRAAVMHGSLFKSLFSGTQKTPTLAQYIPEFICFESVERSILLTGDNSIPLIRYAIGDNGGVMSFTEFKNIVTDFEQMPKKTAEKLLAGPELPFVYIYERSDFSTKLYGAIIFPEHIKAGLMDRKVQKYVTSKFTMITQTNKQHDEYLEINVEMKKGVKSSSELKKMITESIVRHLRTKSAEYENNYHQSPERQTPDIILWPYENQEYFKPGIKQKWVKKSK